jgi:hypothetical protein
MRTSYRTAASLFLACCSICALVPAQAQPGRAPAESWWVNKTEGGVYKTPMRPLWRLVDLKKMHAGQANWSEQIILDPEQDATYNAAAPGTHFTQRLHRDTPTVFVVVAGEMYFNVEGQQPVTATRGSIVNIMKTSLYSYDVAGTEPALWVEVNPTNYKTVYPADGPQPQPSKGGRIVKIAFAHLPGAYSGINKLHWNTFGDGIAKCAPRGPQVLDDHLFVNPLLGYVNPADNKCGTGSLNIGSGPTKDAFNPKSVFGHVHAVRQNGGSCRWDRSAAVLRMRANSTPSKATCSMPRR